MGSNHGIGLGLLIPFCAEHAKIRGKRSGVCAKAIAVEKATSSKDVKHRFRASPCVFWGKLGKVIQGNIKFAGGLWFRMEQWLVGNILSMLYKVFCQETLFPLEFFFFVLVFWFLIFWDRGSLCYFGACPGSSSATRTFNSLRKWASVPFNKNKSNI